MEKLKTSIKLLSGKVSKVLFATALALSLGACGSNSANSISSDKSPRFTSTPYKAIEQETGYTNANISIITDNATGVEYLLVVRGDVDLNVSNCTITPLYDADGTLHLKSEDEPSGQDQ